MEMKYHVPTKLYIYHTYNKTHLWMMITITHQNKSPKIILLLNEPYKKNIVKEVPNPTNLGHK